MVQVGDSRCYFYQDGVLRQVTRDQTLAQELVDKGVLTDWFWAYLTFQRGARLITGDTQGD